jgi:5-methyltetrahydropteroyltriglutamate--homocysteine methyltransferase
MDKIIAYQHGIYPRSEALVAATRDLERGRTTIEKVEDQFRQDLQDFVQTQRDAGLNYFSDGLLRWEDIFRPFVKASKGLSEGPLVRWFDNNAFFRAPVITGSPAIDSQLPPTFEDSVLLPEPKVATLPSPYMFSRAAQTHGDRNKLMIELARNVLQPVAKALGGRGYRLIHLQEPWLVFYGMEQGEWSFFEKAIETIRDGLGITLVLHTYYGNAEPWADRLRSLPVDAVGIDFVETDVEALGKNWTLGVVAGCLDGRRSLVESLEETVKFVKRAAETLNPTALYLSSNSDLELLPRDIASRKILRLGEVARRAKEALR